jgi:hypothetical protein
MMETVLNSVNNMDYVNDPVFLTVFVLLGIKKLFSNSNVSIGSILLLFSLSLCCSKLFEVSSASALQNWLAHSHLDTTTPTGSGPGPDLSSPPTAPIESSASSASSASEESHHYRRNLQVPSLEEALESTQLAKATLTLRAVLDMGRLYFGQLVT